MSLRNCGFVLVLTVICTIGTGQAQDKSPAPKKKDPPTIEQRLAMLEDQAAKMLAEIKAIRGQLKEGVPPASDKNNINIYRLKNADAHQLAKVLTELLNLSRDNKSLRIVADTQTNSLLVAGVPEDQEIIQAIIGRLDDAATDANPPRKDRK